MKTFYGVCVAVVLVLVVITMVLRSESTSFYGIADAQELIINDEFPVEIRKIHVIPGQRVKSGDTLVEVKRPDLDLKIAEINRQLSELRTQKSAHVNLSKSEVLRYKAQQEARVSELRAQIRELEAQLETNRKLVAELRSIKKNDLGADEDSEMTNPVSIKIQQLRHELELTLDTLQTGMGRLTDQLSYAGEPLGEKVKGLQSELDLLLEEKKRSSKTVKIDGLIGAVHFKEGEKLSPFTSIMTVHAESPSYVNGYIHENAHSQVAVGQNVSVSSLADKKELVAGEIVGVGARMVEYPVRLRKSAELQMWGREVTIKIPEANPFLLGEKVLITLRDRKKTATVPDLFMGLWGQRAYAADNAAAPTIDGLPEMNAPVKIKECRFEGMPIEASGVIYLGDLKRYTVISDDTPENKPLVYLVDSDCRITHKAIVQGLDRINDMECICRDEQGAIYIAASQGANRKGKLPDARKMFVTIKRKGESFKLDGRVRLSDWLLAAAGRAPQEQWARFVTSAITESAIDIEGVAVREGKAYFGFKQPFLDGKAVILEIAPVGAIFKAKAAADIRLWMTVDLTDPETGAAGAIADMQFSGPDLFLLSNPENGSAGGILWRCSRDELPVAVWRTGTGNPEGFAFNDDGNALLVVFDNGGSSTF
ncbi:MAG: DUF3616 domain-containing protein [Chitinispirillaceae bacterium]|nr:DUF3616 domain-containing protein [Chitinispirillaceae bacterium]